MPQFERYIGIDYSGAETPDSSLTGLRVYQAGRSTPAQEVLPPPSPRKYWTRRGLAEWLLDALLGGPACLIGIDHGFSFPIRYFHAYGLAEDWPGFLDDFHRHWPTDARNMYVDFVRDGISGDAVARAGSASWRRETEIAAGSAKSVFHFDVPGSVAKSTHAGLPWLRYLRRKAGRQAHFWPFDGWAPGPNQSVLAEVYPALWSKGFPREGRNEHQQDAFAVAEWLRQADLGDALGRYLAPALDPEVLPVARIEGWILGVAPSWFRR